VTPPIRPWLLGVAGSLILVAGVRIRQSAPGFDHPKHARLFVLCSTCHAGAETPGAPLMPARTSCGACHDGAAAKRVDWSPRAGPRASNLRFDHLRHTALRRQRGDTSGSCAECHGEGDGGWMEVRGPRAPQCLGCHAPGGPLHLATPDSACATCHLTLAQATALTADRIARFPAPVSHRATDFLSRGGHGTQARRAGSRRVAAGCAVCHARDFCAACHVDAPEVLAIQALAPDRRSLAVPHSLEAPASHRAAGFARAHGTIAARGDASCRTCHTQESCLACHRAPAPRAVLALYPAGPGRAEGARPARRAPSSHGPAWREGHGPFAAAAMASCAGCHAREECLTCHVPSPARRGGYHPAGYLTRHPADAYSRSGSCADCHNPGEFCQTCHNQAGLSARRTLLGPGGYHDGSRQFLFGHGQAARQGLETCVTCHVERDCLTCHSSVKGRGFSPHGPGFDPERMLRKNPSLCIACHGTAIPRRPGP
jgi:hypothetical protein